MSRAHLFALVVFLAACGGTQTQDESSYRDAYRGRESAVREGLSTGQCLVEATCGSLALIDCKSDVDGPAYYVEAESLRPIEVCGGACLAGPNQNGLCVQCPPAEWTCRRTYDVR